MRGTDNHSNPCHNLTYFWQCQNCVKWDVSKTCQKTITFGTFIWHNFVMNLTLSKVHNDLTVIWHSFDINLTLSKLYQMLTLSKLCQMLNSFKLLFSLLLLCQNHVKNMSNPLYQKYVKSSLLRNNRRVSRSVVHSKWFECTWLRIECLRIKYNNYYIKICQISPRNNAVPFSVRKKVYKSSHYYLFILWIHIFNTCIYFLWTHLNR